MQLSGNMISDWRIKLYCTVLCLKLPKTRLAISIGNSMIGSGILGINATSDISRYYCYT